MRIEAPYEALVSNSDAFEALQQAFKLGEQDQNLPRAKAWRARDQSLPWAKVNMPEQQYPDYKLQPEVFQAWLRKRFSDSSIEVKVRRPEYIDC